VELVELLESLFWLTTKKGQQELFL